MSGVADAAGHFNRIVGNGMMIAGSLPQRQRQLSDAAST